MSGVLRWLARRRVLLGFVSAAAALFLAAPTRRSLAIGAVIAITGELIRIWAAGHLEKGREVTASGPYRFSRHPLYLGSSLMGLGLAVAASSLAVALLVGIYLAITMTAAIRTEEAHLTEKFGAAYPRYRDGHGPLAQRRFSAARAMRNREYRAVLGLVAVLALLLWKAL
jgi:protein-S-isoprenylcysteine O-methyltransferase Ste14